MTQNDGTEAVDADVSRRPAKTKLEVQTRKLKVLDDQPDPRLEAGLIVLKELVSEAFARVDALELKLDSVSKAQKDFEAELTARAVALEKAAKIEPPAPPAWTRPLPSQANPAWTLAPGTEFLAVKSIGHQDVSSVSEFALRARFGYMPDGTRGLSGTDLEAAYALCEKLAACHSPEEADGVVMGAGNLPLDVATARICLGLTAGGKFGTTPLMVALRFYPEKSMDELLKGLT